MRKPEPLVTRELRELRREEARALDRRLDAIQRRIGRIRFRCYICGQESETYVGTPTIPPNALEVLRTEDVIPVVTCGRNYCMHMEMNRQDALVQSILAPQREAYYKRRAEEREKAKEKK